MNKNEVMSGGDNFRICKNKNSSFLLYFIISFLLYGCSGNKYVSKLYPSGNDELSKLAYKGCLEQVPHNVRERAKKTTEVLVPIFIMTSYYSDVQTTTVYECQTECQIARKKQNQIISECMANKGWQIKND